MTENSFDEALKTLRDWSQSENLHAELQPYLTQHRSLGQVLQHPLIYSVPHSDILNRMINQRYQHVRAAVSSAKAQGNYSSYVFLHERAWRLSAFMNIADELAVEEYWLLLRKVWIDSENIHQNLEEWREVWDGDFRDACHDYVMEPQERQALAAMPDEIEIFRGYNVETSKLGMSWTVDREVAAKMACRISFGRQSRIAIGKAKKQHVLAYFDERDESEIVIFPENVDIAQSINL